MKIGIVFICLNFVLCLVWVFYKYFYGEVLENIKIGIEVLNDKYYSERWCLIVSFLIVLNCCGYSSFIC